MSLHVCLRKFDSDCEDTDSKDDASEFKSDCIDSGLITVPPCARVEYVSTIWTYNC